MCKEEPVPQLVATGCFSWFSVFAQPSAGKQKWPVARSICDLRFVLLPIELRRVGESGLQGSQRMVFRVSSQSSQRRGVKESQLIVPRIQRIDQNSVHHFVAFSVQVLCRSHDSRPQFVGQSPRDALRLPQTFLESL